MSWIYSAFVVMGILIILVVIYIVCVIAWNAYRRQVLLAAQGNEPVKMEKLFPSMRWKPFLLTFNILKKDIENGSTRADDDLEKSCGNRGDDDVEKSCGDHECVVCLKVFEDGELARQFPQCQHTFHADCIDKWLYSHSDRCPICRSSINPESSSRRGETSTQENSSHEVSVDPDTSINRAISVCHMPFFSLP
ncbi:hypothetical protein FNV43_RR08155 [Rhamnella rubrinervis]|uniref:RING-type domain-containing protein n=1 Tax=Rhamnella rubrinervis TaxID=2594499 RepID=A0A8K0MN44_9ROSA|nr:hypothetical protein FNV43_RR08155 [Rhamnella rubrinervis]